MRKEKTLRRRWRQVSITVSMVSTKRLPLALAEALKKARVEVTLQVVKGNGHGGPGFNSPESRKLIEDFFARRLGRGGAAARAEAQPPQGS